MQAFGSSSGFIKARVGLDRDGLTLGAGSRLVRFDPRTGRLAVDGDRERCLALLAVATRTPVAPSTIAHLEAAAGYWHRGEKALANLRLVFAGLPQVRSDVDAACLTAAEYLLDHGMTPRELLDGLEVDAAGLGLAKYDPNQPRVPAGQGKESGRWTDMLGLFSDDDPFAPMTAEQVQAPSIIPIAASGPISPRGLQIVPMPGDDPLDPKKLNKPLSPEEQQEIADTLNAILNGSADERRSLNAHPYKNYPHSETGAVLPIGVGGYVTFYVREGSKSPPGEQRIVMSGGSNIYYTNNHYKSFYPVDVVPTDPK